LSSALGGTYVTHDELRESVLEVLMEVGMLSGDSPRKEENQEEESISVMLMGLDLFACDGDAQEFCAELKENRLAFKVVEDHKYTNVIVYQGNLEVKFKFPQAQFGQ